MRTNNGKVKNVIISLYFILIVLAIIAATLLSSFSEVSKNPTVSILIILGIFAVLLVITHNVSKYYEYDSDGLLVVMINKGLLVSDYVNYREKKIEFRKEDLVAYRFHNYIIYKSLVITLKDRHDKKRKEHFNVTLVSRKKRKYIRQSLSKIIRQNKKANN